MLRDGVKFKEQKGLRFVLDAHGVVKARRPWLGNFWAFLYDFVMRHSIFPKKLGADLDEHYATLSQELAGVHHCRVLELGTGTGSSVEFLPKDNKYVGLDVSPGLLQRAVRSFRLAGFKDPEFYVLDIEELPFVDDRFDLVLCVLALNFFKDAKKVFQEVSRVLRPGGEFVCSVPVPERNQLQSQIRGTLYSEQELRGLSEQNGFSFTGLSQENGGLFYFRAQSRKLAS